MATVTTAKVAEGVMTRSTHSGAVAVYATFAHPTTGGGSAAGDIIQMVKIPEGARILDVVLAVDDLDTNATPTIELDVGDGGDVDRFIDGSTAGQAGGITRLNSQVGADFVYTADDTIDVKVVTAAATKAAGDIHLAVLYTMES